LNGSVTPEATENKDFLKGHQSRKSSITTRARSLSTDEERPDSRSTDEEITQNSPQKERSIMKSVSTGRVPRTLNGFGLNSSNNNSRSISCERTRDLTPFRQRLLSADVNAIKIRPIGNMNEPQNQKPRWNACSKSKSNINFTPKPPTRSLSASGTAEFYGRTSNAPRNVFIRSRGTTPNPSSVNNNSRTNGKNTWTGPSPVAPGATGGNRSRMRPNLFNSNFFNNSEVIARPQPLRTKSNDSDFSNTSSTIEPNLAEWIKRALELDSDADKISHIELAIQQFENQNQREDSPELSSYNSNSSTDNQESLPYIEDSSLNSNLSIRKRKENGITKIPRPSFY